MNTAEPYRHRTDPQVWEDPLRLALATRDITAVYQILQKLGFSQQRITAMTNQTQPESVSDHPRQESPDLRSAPQDLRRSRCPPRVPGPGLVQSPAPRPRHTRPRPATHTMSQPVDAPAKPTRPVDSPASWPAQRGRGAPSGAASTSAVVAALSSR
jgi:hypothetical protein